MTSFITGILVLVSLIVGFGMKLYFGEKKGEAAQDFIENVVKRQTGVDLDPIFDLDNEEEDQGK